MFSNVPVLLDALVLSAVGMFVVFLFLAGLVGILSLMRFVRPSVPGDLQASPVPVMCALTEQRKKVAAIAVAVYEHEKRHL